MTGKFSFWLYCAMGYARELGGTDDTYWLWLAYNRHAVGSGRHAS